MGERRVAEVFPPGEFIREELDARGWSQAELAEIIGRNSNVVYEIVNGKRAITPETARALGHAFGTSAQYWMNMESAYQLWKTKDTGDEISRRARLYELAPIKEMVRRHWLAKSESIDVLEQRAMIFFEKDNLDNPFDFPHAARRGTQKVTPSQIAWLYRAKQLASGVPAAPFTNRSIRNAMANLKPLLASAEGVRLVPRVLADAGIRFLIVEHLPKTRIDGVTFWLDKKSPVIALSLRYDRIDWFWHTLSHELGHVKERDGLNKVILDTDLVGQEVAGDGPEEKRENRANAFATNFLIDQTSLDDFVARIQPLYGKQKILGFAGRMKVHPGIVVGQLQFRQEIQWSMFRAMLEKVRHIVVQSSLTDGWGQIVPAFD